MQSAEIQTPFHGGYRPMGEASVDAEAFMNYYDGQRWPRRPLARGSTII